MERLDAHLEVAYERLIALKGIFSKETERLHDTPNYVLSERDFQRYRVQALRLVEEVAPIMEAILTIEPELDPKFILPPDKIIDDDFNLNEREVLQELDKTWLEMLRGRIHDMPRRRSDPFDPVIAVVELARQKIDFVLKDPVVREL